MTVMTYDRTVGVRELKVHLSEVLRAVKSGERIEVTERGKVIAVLAAPPAVDEAELPERLQQLIAEGRVTPARRPGPFPLVTPIASDWTVEAFLAEERGEE